MPARIEGEVQRLESFLGLSKLNDEGPSTGLRRVG